MFKGGIGALVLLAVIGRSEQPQPDPPPLTAEQRYLQSATLQGRESTIRELHGENFGTGIACVFRHLPESSIIEYDTQSGASVPEAYPYKYELVANGHSNRFDAVIEPGTAALYRVLVSAKGERVTVKTLNLFAPPRHGRYDERYTFTLPDGDAHFSTYGAEKFAITHDGSNFYMTYSCNDAYMEDWVDLQNDANEHFQDSKK